MFLGAIFFLNILKNIVAPALKSCKNKGIKNMIIFFLDLIINFKLESSKETYQ